MGERINGRLDAMSERIDGMGARIDARLDGLQSAVLSLERRLTATGG